MMINIIVIVITLLSKYDDDNHHHLHRADAALEGEQHNSSARDSTALKLSTTFLRGREHNTIWKRIRQSLDDQTDL